MARVGWVWTGLAVVLLLAAAIRFRMLEVPLERDEGEYAYAGQLMLQGVAPYGCVYSVKFPGIYAVYAVLLALFGESHVGIRCGLLVVNVATGVLIFLLARRLFDAYTALVTTAAFSVLSLSQSVEGVLANAEQFVVIFAVGGILVLLDALRTDRARRYFWSGLLLGSAFMTKQHGVAFGAFGGVYLLSCLLASPPVHGVRVVVRVALFTLGLVLPFVVTCCLLVWAGVFSKFWFWTFVYARRYLSTTTHEMAWENVWRRWDAFSTTIVPLLALAAMGLLSAAWNRSHRGRIGFLLLFTAFSALSVCPGWIFRRHYFILMVPAVALCAGVGASALLALLPRRLVSRTYSAAAVLLLCLATLPTLYLERSYLFFQTPDWVIRNLHGSNPFPESPEIARYIRENTEPQDTIAVLGSEPQICFYAKRRSATGYVYTYELMRDHEYALQMQEEMIREIEAARPEILVAVRVRASWLIHRDSPRRIFEWFDQYAGAHYRTVGAVDLASPTGVRFYWGQSAEHFKPHHEAWLIIMKRKNDAA